MTVSRIGVATLVGVIMLVSLATAAVAGDMTREQAEELGIDLGQPAGTGTPPGSSATRATHVLADFLLIPDSTNDRVMSFDPVTGDLIDADFIPSDATNLSTPIHAILSPTNDSILVSDQIEDVVQEYGLDGTYQGVYAPAGGANTAILDNVRGMALRANGNLLVTVGGGTNDDAVAEFDGSGAHLGNFVANAAGGLDSPFDVLLGTEALVGAISSDGIYRYDLTTGAFVAVLTAINTFPEQLAFAAGGNLLVANFSGTEAGIVEYQPDGTQVGIYNAPTLGGYRGVFELPSGNLLVTTGTGVHEIDRAGNLIETKIASVSARFIELITGAVPVELQSFSVE